MSESDNSDILHCVDYGSGSESDSVCRKWRLRTPMCEECAQRHMSCRHYAESTCEHGLTRFFRVSARTPLAVDEMLWFCCDSCISRKKVTSMLCNRRIKQNNRRELKRHLGCVTSSRDIIRLITTFLPRNPCKCRAHFRQRKKNGVC